jgi:anthranilate synthase component 2
VRVLVVDNYDSFAYNLVQYVGEVVTDPDWGVVAESGAGEVVVRRNDEVTLDDVDAIDPDGIVVSPGPGTPQSAGVSVPLFAERDYPTLGVCLGHQALCAANGAPVGHAEAVVHGKHSVISHDGNGLFADLPEQFEVGRYHSLAVERADLPESLVETAWTLTHEGNGGESDHTEPRVLMGVRHRERPHYGVQFHPESILTDSGKRLIAAFCHRCTTTT